MRKKFKVTLVVFLVVVLGCFSQAFAATNQNAKLNRIVKQIRNVKLLDSTSTNDGGVVGTSNLNGTTDNSAKIGDKLLNPEIGWKRYDDDKKIKLNGNWTYYTTDGNWNNSTHYQTKDLDSTVSFKFYGSKLRIFIAQDSVNNTGGKQEVFIDGVDYGYYEYFPNKILIKDMLVYEKLNLSIGIHSVEIKTLDYKNTNQGAGFDCIDIDSTGYLIDSSTPNPTPTTGNRATLTINMVNGSTKQYDLSEDELNSFLSWYNGMTNPLSSQCYVFNNPIIGPYLNNKDYITFNKIDDFKIQEYTK